MPPETTPLVRRTAVGRDEPVQRVVVKGSSWAGLEDGRPTAVVAAAPAARGGDEAEGPLVLSADAARPEFPMLHPCATEVFYLGAFPTPEHIRLHVRQWVPKWQAWAETQFSVQQGDAIKWKGPLTVESAAGNDTSRQRLEWEIDTGCVTLRHEPNVWLDIRDAAGRERRIEQMKIRRPGAIAIAPSDGPESAPPRALAQTAQCAARMLARPDGRYVNVGFRCVKPLWTPPAPPADAAPVARYALPARGFAALMGG